MRKRSGISTAEGIGRRNSTGTRNARPASSLAPSRIPIGTASTVAISEAERPATHGVAEGLPELGGLQHRPELLHRRAHRGQVGLPRSARPARPAPRARAPPQPRSAATGSRRLPRAVPCEAAGPGSGTTEPRATSPRTTIGVLYIARHVEYPRRCSSSRDATADACCSAVNHYDRGMSAFDGLFVPADLRAAVSSRAWLEAMLDAERALANAGAIAGTVPADLAAEIAGACDPDRFDFEQLLDGGPHRRQPRRAARARPRRRGRRGRCAVRAPRRDEPGHPRHGRDARLPPGARARARRGRPRRGGGCGARTRSPRDADGRANAPAARRADHVRPQGRRLADRGRRGTRTARRRSPGNGWRRSWAEPPERSPASATAASRCSTSTHASSTFRLRRCPGTRTGLASRSSAPRLPPQPVSPRRSRSISCCSRRPRSPRWRKAAGRDGRRRCRRSATRSARRSPARTPGSRRLTPASCSGRWSRSTSAPPAPGRPSGRRSPARSRTRAGRSHALAGALESLEVDAARMRRNLDLTGGLVLAERVAFLLMERLGRAEAQEVVREAAAAESFRDALLADPRTGLDAAELDAALDPSTYLGLGARARRPRARVLRELPARSMSDCTTGSTDRRALRPCCSATRSGRRSRCGTRRFPRSRRASGSSATTGAATAARRSRRARTRSRIWVETPSACSTSSGSSEPRSAACRSAASSACGSRRRRRSGSTASSSAAPRRACRRESSGSTARRRCARRGSPRSPRRLSTAGSRRARPTRCGRRSATMLVETPAEGYAGCCEALAEARSPRPAGRDRGSDARRHRGGGSGRTAGRRRPARRFHPGRTPRDDRRGAAHIANAEQPSAFTQHVLAHLTEETR